MPAKLAIINSGGANIASLRYALERLGSDAVLTTDPAVIASAERVILPGVGAAADAMQRLQDSKLTSLVPELRQPVLGICLGMQLLATHSDENDTECLGVFPGRATRLANGPDLPVPNMGWCQLSLRRQHPLLDGIDEGAWFYFVHSYALPADDDCIASAEHSSTFSAVASRGNFHAAQCHPERSSAAGSRLLQNFLALPA